jgi:hypothetical protein
VTVCSLAVHTAAIRLTFAMARDNALPFGEKLARVNSKTQTPIVPAIVIGVIAELILVVNIGQPKIFTVLTSIAVIMIYLAYLMVTGPLLKKRLEGQWPPADLVAGGYFTMGRWGMFVNIVAVLWGTGMAINLAWPREAVYGAPWYNTWGAVVYIAVILGAGLCWYAVKGCHHIGTLAYAVCEGQYRHLHVQRLRRVLLPDQGQQTAGGRQGRARQVLRPRGLRPCGGQRQLGGTQVVHRALQIQHTGLTPAAETTHGTSPFGYFWEWRDFERSIGGRRMRVVDEPSHYRIGRGVNHN